MPTYQIPVNIITSALAIVEADNTTTATQLVERGEYEDLLEDFFYIEVVGAAEEVTE